MSPRDSRRLEAAIESAREGAHELSLENQSRLAQIMTIWASGYLEATCREVLGDYSARRANPAVARYVSRNLERFANPNVERIVDLVRSFNDDYARELEDFARGEIKEGINGMIALRNQIAHGRSTDTTIARVSQQFSHARTLANKLKSRFGQAA